MNNLKKQLLFLPRTTVRGYITGGRLPAGKRKLFLEALFPIELVGKNV
jgi:hypothetical protein